MAQPGLICDGREPVLALPSALLSCSAPLPRWVPAGGAYASCGGGSGLSSGPAGMCLLSWPPATRRLAGVRAGSYLRLPRSTCYRPGRPVPPSAQITSACPDARSPVAPPTGHRLNSVPAGSSPPRPRHGRDRVPAGIGSSASLRYRRVPCMRARRCRGALAAFIYSRRADSAPSDAGRHSGGSVAGTRWRASAPRLPARRRNRRG
jgi:hypothetical protein